MRQIALTGRAGASDNRAMRWRFWHPRPAVARRSFGRERDALEHLIATTDNVALAELARLRLRATRFAESHLTPTAAAGPIRDVTPDSLEVELQRSLSRVARPATTTAGPSPRAAAALARIAAEPHPAIDEPPERYAPPVAVGLLLLVWAAVAAMCLNPAVRSAAASELFRALLVYIVLPIALASLLCVWQHRQVYERPLKQPPGQP